MILNSTLVFVNDVQGGVQFSNFEYKYINCIKFEVQPGKIHFVR